MKSLTLFLLLFITSSTLTAHKTHDFKHNKDVSNFKKNLVTKHGFKTKVINKWFNKITYNSKSIELMDKQFERQSWQEYRSKLINKKRVQKGVAFWKTHKKTLSNAAKQHKVPEELILAVLGIESSFGRNTGKYKVVNVLSSLAFYYPRRMNFFKNELKEFFIYCKNNDISPFKIKGSYAGAIGLGQFMPSSIMNYAVSATPGSINLMNIDDATFSIANYFSAMNWKYGESIALPILKKSAIRKKLTDKDKSTTVLAMNFKNVDIPSSITPKTRLKLYKFDNDKISDWWVTFPNFKAILKYNNHQNYAMAILQLSLLLKKNKNLNKIDMNITI